ncbi:hypothetical protein CHS0354_008492 [Potamilus streckersoni]|uniref:Uncharacterized protein n=1 Tax=Potamilus streckersoni TaxID=2493646 RepID=A0AAE0S8T1_9BIVA|nr:hypothetical protein CHS0354_008492 [Potamilus streckersoni]
MGPLEMKFVVIFAILIGLKQADAINCYFCGMLDVSCNDPFNAYGVTTIMCIGSCVKVKAKDSSSNAYASMRGCSTKLAPANICAESTYGGITGTVCYCKDNLCNYALPVGSSMIVMATAMIINIALH